MGLVPGQGFPSKAKAFLKPGHCRFGIGNTGFWTQDPDEARLDEFAEGRLSLGCRHFGPMEEIVRKIDRGLHEQ